MYKLKQFPEDFVVKEISSINQKEKGPYLYFRLSKKNWNTLDVIKKIAKILHIKEKQIGFAGSKDKQAVTEQICSIKGVSKDKLVNLEINNVKLEFFGYGDLPISLGDLEGNKFEIVVRNLEQEKLQEISFIENYFDEQRFSKNNVKIGRHLVKKEFSEAVKLVDDYSCQEYLRNNKTDFIGALRKVPIRLLRFYINAYQSYLWNETLAKYLENKYEKIKKISYSQGKLVFVNENLKLEIPLIGFSEITVNEEIIKDLMKKENIEHSDFIIKQIPELSLEGEMRKAMVWINNLTIGKKEVDELNKDKKKVKISFSLPKGSYATMVIRKLMQK